jgi:hypothetical protein
MRFEWTGSIIREAPGSIRTATASDGFYIRLVPNESLQIACGTCREPVYQAT